VLRSLLSGGRGGSSLLMINLIARMRFSLAVRGPVLACCAFVAVESAAAGTVADECVLFVSLCFYSYREGVCL